MLMQSDLVGEGDVQDGFRRRSKRNRHIQCQIGCQFANAIGMYNILNLELYKGFEFEYQYEDAFVRICSANCARLVFKIPGSTVERIFSSDL